jgi:hypothetical protein
MIAERERDIWVSWHTAYLHRIDVKHFPKLTEMLERLKPSTKAGPEQPQDRKTLSRNLMNALLQLPTAPPPPKDSPTGARRALDASDPLSAPPPPVDQGSA